MAHNYVNALLYVRIQYKVCVREFEKQNTVKYISCIYAYTSIIARSEKNLHAYMKNKNSYNTLDNQEPRRLHACLYIHNLPF